MLKKITCKQVQAILPFYLKGRVNPLLCAMIEEHLSSCKKCKELYMQAIDENQDLCMLSIDTTTKNEHYATKEYEKFKLKLSAYLDSELDDSESIKIKKITISNPLARKDLENMYQFKRLLHSSFNRTMEKCKLDFSKNIVKKLNNKQFVSSDYLLRITTVILIISTILAAIVLINGG